MKRGVLFLNGVPPTREEIEAAVKKADCVFCTDGAYAYLSGIRLPDGVVGDFDSLVAETVCDKCEKIAFEADKDYTDGFLAVKIMLERGVDDIDIYGAYGYRPDMADCNYALLALAHKKGVAARLCGDMDTYLVSDKFTARVPEGKTVSVAPFGDSVHILYMKGLKYALSDYTMCRYNNVDSPDYIMGVSNVSLGGEVEIKVEGGIALIYVQQGR